MANFQPERRRRGFDPEVIPPPARGSLTVLVLVMAGGLVALGVVLVLLGAEPVAPEPWMLALVALATVFAWGAVLTPFHRGRAVQTVQATVVLRIALLEAPAILGFALAVVARPPNALLYALPAAFSLLGIWLFARPAVVLARLSRAA